PPPIVVLIGAADDQPLMNWIAAELRALDMTIDVRRVVSRIEPLDAEADALADGARAVMRIDSGAGRLSVVIADPVTHGIALREGVEGPPTTHVEPVVALRAVELVRAVLVGSRYLGDGGTAPGAPGKPRVGELPATPPPPGDEPELPPPPARERAGV